MDTFLSVLAKLNRIRERYKIEGRAVAVSMTVIWDSLQEGEDVKPAFVDTQPTDLGGLG